MSHIGSYCDHYNCFGTYVQRGISVRLIKLRWMNRCDHWPIVLFTMLGGTVGLNACQPSPAPQALSSSNNQLNVTVSIPPQKYFVEKIGAGYVNVNVMVPPGAEPHTFEPKPEQLKALARSQVYFRLRISFEDTWMEKFKTVNPQIRIIDTTAGIALKSAPIASSRQDSPQSTSSHQDDPHIWLSPRRVKQQAKTIYQTLAQLDPAHQAKYQANLQQFTQEIEQLDQEIQQSLSNLKNRQFIVFHPSWGYFAADYNLKMIPIEVDGQEPSAAEMAQLIKQAKTNRIQVVFAAPQFSTRSANLLAQEIQGQVLIVDPLAENWTSNLRKTAQIFARTMQSRYSPRDHGVSQLLVVQND